MLEMYDFTVVQVRYIKAAMDQIASFHPDGLTTSAVAALTPNPDPIRANYITKKDAAGTARDARNNGATGVHDVCIDFLAQATSVYRKNPAVSEQLGRVMRDDKTFSQCMTRGDQSSAVWANLPQVGSPLAAFVVLRDGSNVSKATFDGLITTARAADVALPGLDQAFQKAEADLHVKHHDLDDFVSAALMQGRSAYSEGTGEREIIDAIPTVPFTHVPDKAVITSMTFVGGGLVVAFDAPHATTFRLLGKTPGQPDYSVLVDDTVEKSFTLSVDSHGDWFFKAIGINSRGEGPESDEASVSG